MQLLHRTLYAVCGVFVLTFSSWVVAQTAGGGKTTTIHSPRSTGDGMADTEVGPTKIAYSELPDSPGAVKSQEQGTSQSTQDPNPPQEPVPQQTQEPQAQPAQQQTQEARPESNSQSQGATAPPAQAEQKPQRPVGTAAAEAPMVSGITAAQPAGVAVAPAKQHRVRTLVIKVGAIAGAAVALGTTMALTMGTPSKPPGAH